MRAVACLGVGMMGFCRWISTGSWPRVRAMRPSSTLRRLGLARLARDSQADLLRRDPEGCLAAAKLRARSCQACTIPLQRHKKKTSRGANWLAAVPSCSAKTGPCWFSRSAEPAEGSGAGDHQIHVDLCFSGRQVSEEPGHSECSRPLGGQVGVVMVVWICRQVWERRKHTDTQATAHDGPFSGGYLGFGGTSDGFSWHQSQS